MTTQDNATSGLPKLPPPDVAMEAVRRLGRDLLAGATTLNINEVRFLVDAYYDMQDHRKGSKNQIRSIEQGADEAATHLLLDWLSTQQQTMEDQIKRALDTYSLSHMIGPWLRGIYGIGPVIAAGLLAHIDIEKAPTVGHIWRFAGLDPSRTWGKGQKRPHNAGLKTLCWKIGQSFLKFHNQTECYYGKVYEKRKVYEIERNEAGGCAEAAAAKLERFKISKTTEAYKIYSTGKLPPAHIEARAERYAVKRFLADLHAVWYEKHFGRKPPLPYPIAIMGHAHHIEPPQ